MTYLTRRAAAGYKGERNPFSGTCLVWFAHELGRHLKATKQPEPKSVYATNERKFAVLLMNGDTVRFETVMVEKSNPPLVNFFEV